MKLTESYLFGPTSDVFVYQNTRDDFVCQFCSLTEDTFFRARDVGEMLAHMEEHMDDGDKVPDRLIADLKKEK